MRIKLFNVIAVAVLLVLSLPLVSCSSTSDSSDSKDYFGQKIEFQNSIDGTLDPDAELKFDVAKLTSQLPADKTYYVSETPVLTDYAIVSKLEFNKEKFEVSDNNQRTYITKENGVEKWLKIDRYGKFTYKSGIKATSSEIKLSDRECYDTAKQFLQNNGLFIEEFGAGASVETAESTYSESEGNKITAKCVIFAVEDGYSRSTATVNINAEGEVISATYNVKKFKNHHKIKLITLQEAVEQVKRNNALINVGMATKYSELDFEKVSVGHYEQADENGGIIVQPVYIFEGTVIATDGETAKFQITVQANKYK